MRIPDIHTKSHPKPVMDVWPDYKHILLGEKADITLEHLLCMTSGLSWDEWSTSYEDPANDVVAMFRADDPIEYILSKPMINSPGDEFHYNSGGTNVHGAIIEKETGMSLLDFANEYLFDPLNVQGGLVDQEMIITINSGNFDGTVTNSIFAFVQNHILPGLL